MPTDKTKPFRAILITKGRKTGREHAVMLRAVYYGGKYYFSRHRPDGDWYQNAIQGKIVKIQVDDQVLVGNATTVTDEELSKKISELKYPGEDRAKEPRVAIEVALNE